MKRSFLYLFAFLCIQLFTAWLTAFVWYAVSGTEPSEALRLAVNGDGGSVNAPLMITQTAVYGAVTMFVFIFFRWSAVSPAYLRTRQWGVFFWCAVAALGTIIPMLGLQQLVPLPDIARQSVTALIDDRFGYIALCIFAPLVEELVFRGAILRSLLRAPYSPAIAITVSAIIFAAAHLNPAQMPHAFIIGLLLGWMYLRTGSILPGTAFHWVNNTIVYAWAVIAPYMQDMTLTEIFRGNTRNALLAVVFSLLILLPALYQLNRSMKKAEEVRRRTSRRR